MKPTKPLAIAAFAALSCSLPLVAPAKADPINWTSPTLIDARASMFFPGPNYLTFQHFDKLFATRTVAAGPTVWQLPSDPQQITGPFQFDNEQYELDGFLEQTRTNALLVIKNGSIVHEQYRNSMTPTTRHTVFSMSKSVIATLIGIAREEGAIGSLSDEVTDYLPAMKGSAYENVTLEDLLRMRSGVNWEERYEFGSDTQLTEVHDNALVAYQYRWCDYAAGAEPLHSPGEHFNYSTLDTSVLGCVLAKATGTTVADYMAEKLWQPAGMEQPGYWIMDGPESVGDEFYGAGFNATLRDLGRFGLMMLNNGQANGRQVVPAAWVHESTVPSAGYEPTEPGESLGYQYQWWTLADSNAYSAIGLFNQFIYIDPDRQVVIVKLSYTDNPLGWEEPTIHFFKQVAEQF
ncbi:serine hydrolase domain-containing protein [Saccharospirillum impatiens]|uniref:serine hydrolase domain-containing protein n=1 Tax=Saccharospirillum impatiens TaxID=169438 RepID=UPI00042A56ED|nr:serine hydrolase [Saccharospirillum impatiens]